MSDRAVSEVISYVLVFGLIVSAVGIISVSGLATLQDVRDNEQIANAERAFDVMSDNIADIHRRGAPSRATEISLGEAELATGPNVTMRVEIDTDGDGDWNDGDADDGLGYQRNLRPIIYDGEGERQLVYEAGATFRTNRDGGVIVQEPPFILDDDRVHVPIIGLNRPQAQSLGGSTVLVRTRLQSTSVEYENRGGNVEGIRISILGTDPDRAALWREYYDNRGFSCAGGPGPDVVCTFEPGSIGQVYVVDYDISVTIDP
jgi:hypothetical protein